MPRKEKIGRRHKNGTGNNKNVAAKRRIVRTQKRVAKKAKKRPVQTVVFVLEQDDDVRSEGPDDTIAAEIEETRAGLDDECRYSLRAPGPDPARQHLPIGHVPRPLHAAHLVARHAHAASIVHRAGPFSATTLSSAVILASAVAWPGGSMSVACFLSSALRSAGVIYMRASAIVPRLCGEK